MSGFRSWALLMIHYKVNFYYKSKDGWSLMETEHTLNVKDVLHKIQPPNKVFTLRT